MEFDRNKYFIGCDFARRPNWWIRTFQKFGFYKNYHTDYTAIFYLHDNGVVEHIKNT